MAGRDPAIHVFLVCVGQKTWGDRGKPGPDSRRNAWVIINEGAAEVVACARARRIRARCAPNATGVANQCGLFAGWQGFVGGCYTAGQVPQFDFLAALLCWKCSTAPST